MSEKFVIKGLGKPKWSPEQLKLIESFKRNKDVTGPCPCGQAEAARCELCGGPACDGKLEICCPCFDGAMC
jgi:hypothetical protein